MAGPIRQPIDLDKLTRYIEQHVPEIQTPLVVKQFGYGQSNPTYLLASPNGNKYVMRKKPPGKLLSKTAHQVDREYRIIHALEHTDVPVPRALCMCDDETIVGTKFYIMSFLDGRIFEDPAIPEVTPAERSALWKSAITTLAKFHRVAPESVDMTSFGRANGFYNRQLKTFATLSKAQAATKDIDTHKPVGDIPHYDEMVTFFGTAATQPRDRSTFVHGDFKIDNLVFHRTEPRVIGILDWEMATIGHPWSDVANLLNPFTIAASREARDGGRANVAFVPGATPGLPTVDDCTRWYAEVARAPIPPAELKWAEAFAMYRNSIIMQGIAARYAVRQASSEKARDYAGLMGPFGNICWGLVCETKQKIDESNGSAKL